MAKKAEKSVGAVVVSTVESAELAERISDLRASLGPTEGHRVKLWRYNDVARENELLPSVALDQFSDEQVQQLYGGGKYSARVVNAEGKFVAGGAWAFRVGGPPKFPNAEAPAAAASTGNPFQIGSLGDLKTLMEVIGGGGGKDPGSIAIQVATAMAAMQQQNMNLMLTLLGREKSSGMGNVAETIDAVMSIAERFKGDGGNSSDPLLAAAFGTLAESLKTIAENQRNTPQPRQLPPARAPEVGAEPPPEPGSAVAFNPTKLRPFVQQLVILAQRGKDPVLYADVLLDQLDDHPEAASYLEQQDTPEKRAALQQNLYRLFPAAAPHREWIDKLFTSVWEAIDAPPDDETPTE